MSSDAEAPASALITALRDWQSPRLALAAVLLGLALGLSGERATTIAEDAPRVDYLPGAEGATKVRIERMGRGVTLARKGGDWVLSSDFDAPVPKARVEALLKNLGKLSSKRIASRVAEKHALFQVDEGSTRITLSKGDAVLGEVFLGRAGVDPKTLFVRAAGDDIVAIASPNAPEFRWVSAADWVDRSLLPGVGMAMFRSLTFSQEDEPQRVVIRREGESSVAGEGWAITEPISHPARVASMESLLDQLAQLSASQPADPSAPESITGLEASATALRATLADGREVILTFGKVQSGQRYVRSSLQAGLFKLPESQRRRLFPDPEALRENDILSFEVEDVRRLQVRKGEGLAIVERPAGDGPWRMTQPDASDCDGAAIRAILRHVKGLRFIERRDEAPEASGLSEPVLSLTLGLPGGDAELAFGAVLAPEEGSEEAPRQWVRSGGAVYLVPAKGFEGLGTDVRDLRGSLFDFSHREVAAVVQQRTGVGNVLAMQRDQLGEWVGFVVPRVRFKLDSKRVTRLIKALAGFKRGALAEDQTLEGNDLAKPEVAWRMSLQSGARHDLYIGAQRPDGKVPVFTNRLRPIVLVDPEDLEPLEVDLVQDLRSRSLTEFRFQADMLQELVVGPRAAPLTLRRDPAGSWQLAAPPGPANTGAIEALVKALQSAEATGFETAEAARRELLQSYEYELRLLFPSMSNLAYWIGPEREDATRLIARPIAGVVDVAYILRSEDIAPLLLSLDDLRAKEALGGWVNQASRLRIAWKDGKTVALTKGESGLWQIDGTRSRGDETQLRVLLAQLSQLKPEPGQEVGAEPGLDPPEVTITVGDGAGREVRLAVGAKGQIEGARHVRIGEEGEPFVARSFVFESMIRNPSDYVDRQLIPGSINDYEAVRWRIGERRIALGKGPDRQWRIVEPAGKTADIGRITQHLSALRNLQRYGDGPEAAAITSADLANPVAEVEVTRVGGETWTLRFGRRTDGRARIVSVSDLESPVAVAEGIVDPLLPELRELEDHTVLAIPSRDIRSLEVSFGDASASARFVEGSWVLADGSLADTNHLSRLTRIVTSLRDDGPVPAELAASLDFERPVLTLTARTAEASHTVEVARIDAPGRRAYLRVDGGAPFASDAGPFVGFEAWTPRYLGDMVLAQLAEADIQALTFTRGERTLSLIRGEEGWHREGAEAEPLPAEALAPVFQTLRMLRGDAPAATDDPSKEGLAEPEASLTVTPERGEPWTLAFSAKRDEQTRERAVSRSGRIRLLRYGRADRLLDALTALLEPQGD